ncbi:MAG: GMC oxidoreductase [Pseudolabrys sp.]|jgi:choline dehydrogenase-like flavoprotein
MSSNSSFRAKLKAQPTVGVVLQSASPLVAHSMSAAGFDWLVIDPINSPLSQLESFGMETAVGDGNLTPVLMRVGGPTDRSGIQQATDTGAAGVLVPNVRSANVSDTAAIVRLDAAREIPDMRILCRWRVLPEHPAWLVDFAAVAIDPASRGQVTLVSADPMRPARIDPGYLTAPADTAVLRRGVDLARAIAATAACRAAGIGAEVLPGAGRTLAHIRQHADTAFHPVGTCRLGGDAGAVVDPWLRVVGISGLRVVDASVMPTTVAGNAQAAVLAIAERAADFIRTGL